MSHTCQKQHHLIERVVDELPDSQRSPHRHKCAACAYERGLDEGYQRGLKEASAVIDDLIRAGCIRREDAVCPGCGAPHVSGSHRCHGSASESASAG